MLNMTTLELGAMLASYALATVRLLGVAKPLADGLPKWAQFVIVSSPIALTQFAGLAGVAHTNLDLANALLQLFVTLAIAHRGMNEPAGPVKVSVTIPQAAPPGAGDSPAPKSTSADVTQSITGGLGGAALLALLFLGFHVSACAASPCSFANESYSAHVATCDARIGAECALDAQRKPVADCPVLVECEAWAKSVCQ